MVDKTEIIVVRAVYLLGFAAIVLTSSYNVAKGALVGIEFSAFVTNIDDDRAQTIFRTYGIEVGNTITGAISWDTAIQDSNQSNPRDGSFDHAGSTAAMMFLAGGLSFLDPILGVNTANDVGADAFGVLSEGFIGRHRLLANFTLNDQDAAVFSSDGIPPVSAITDLTEYEIRNFGFSVRSSSENRPIGTLVGRVDTFITQVNEAATPITDTEQSRPIADNAISIPEPPMIGLFAMIFALIAVAPLANRKRIGTLQISKTARRREIQAGTPAAV